MKCREKENMTGSIESNELKKIIFSFCPRLVPCQCFYHAMFLSHKSNQVNLKAQFGQRSQEPGDRSQKGRTLCLKMRQITLLLLWTTEIFETSLNPLLSSNLPQRVNKIFIMRAVRDYKFRYFGISPAELCGRSFF